MLVSFHHDKSDAVIKHPTNSTKLTAILVVLTVLHLCKQTKLMLGVNIKRKDPKWTETITRDFSFYLPVLLAMVYEMGKMTRN